MNSELIEPATEQLLLQLTRDSLAQYALAQLPKYELSPFHELVIGKLEQLEAGKLDRLMLAVPPQHGKSTIVSQLFPAWYLGRHPSHFIISAAYGQDFARKKFGRAVRNFINSPLHQAAFPECQIPTDSTSMGYFNFTAGGHYIATGRGGQITGQSANIVIIDDPLKNRKEASSEGIRQDLKDWYSDVVYTRLRGKCAVCLIATRWHVDDLMGWLLRDHGDENWTVIELPAIALEGDLLGRLPGEALWPTEYPLSRLAQIKRQMTTSSWLSLYQQKPTLGAGYLFQRSWIQFYDPKVNPWGFKEMNRAILVDPANSQKQGSDYTYMWVVGASEDRNYYILDVVRDHFTLVERANKLFELHKKWGQPEIVGYEEYGMSADIAHINDKMSRDHYQFRVIPLAGKLHKADRIERLEPLFRQARFRFPPEIEYTSRDGISEDLIRCFIEEEYVNYVTGGGGVKHDDGLDALSRIFDVPLEFPTTSLISAAYRLFEKSRELRRKGGTPWSA